jgi:hypothetical protein
MVFKKYTIATEEGNLIKTREDSILIDKSLFNSKTNENKDNIKNNENIIIDEKENLKNTKNEKIKIQNFETITLSNENKKDSIDFKKDSNEKTLNFIRCLLLCNTVFATIE